MQDLFGEIKSLLNIKDVLDYYGIQFNSKGSALCPFHNEKTPSLRINNKNNTFKCFGCGERGTSIDFVMKQFSLTTIEAAKQLNKDFNLNLMNKPPPNFSQKSIAKFKDDKALIEEFRQWEKQAFITLSSYFRALKFWGEMLYVRQIEYFRQYEDELENILFVETLVDLMIENTNNIEEQIKFYKNFRKEVQEIEDRRIS